MRDLKNEIEKEQEQNIQSTHQQEQQQQQQKKPKHTLYVYIGNRKPETYSSEEWSWTYESETIRGYIQEYAKPETDIVLYKYDILSIMKRDKSKLIIISGNYVTKEILERE